MHKIKVINKKEKSYTKKNEPDNSEYDFIRSDERNQPAYLKSQNRYKSNHQIILEYTPDNQSNLWFNKSATTEPPFNILGNNSQLMNSTKYKLNSKSVPFDLSYKNESDYEDEYFLDKNQQLVRKQQPFNDEMCKNLEKMIIKMQNSFDPFKLKDEHLKFSILKEILECQRLLLTYNLFSKNDNSNNEQSILTITEIYDEWKVLAMIVDRICFVFYLLSLIISSLLFVMSEQDFIE